MQWTDFTKVSYTTVAAEGDTPTSALQTETAYVTKQSFINNNNMQEENLPAYFEEDASYYLSYPLSVIKTSWDSTTKLIRCEYGVNLPEGGTDWIGSLLTKKNTIPNPKLNTGTTSANWESGFSPDAEYGSGVYSSDANIPQEIKSHLHPISQCIPQNKPGQPSKNCIW